MNLELNFKNLLEIMIMNLDLDNNIFSKIKNNYKIYNFLNRTFYQDLNLFKFLLGSNYNLKF